MNASANSHELPELGNYNYNLIDRFPVITGEYGGNAVVYDRNTGWVWHNAPGGARGTDSGVWGIRFIITEGQAFWFVYRNGRHVATAPAHGLGWQGAVDIAAAIQGELDYERELRALDSTPRGIDDEFEDGVAGNYHNLDYTYPLIPGPDDEGFLYDRITGWVWQQQDDFTWASGAYRTELPHTGYGWDLYYKDELIGVGFGLWVDAIGGALRWEQYHKVKYGKV